MKENRELAPPSTETVRHDLRADCERCLGLCCVAPAFATSADFAIDKATGEACLHLQPDLRCGIHQDLRQLGFPGCTVFDCFGAGQKVSQVTFAGQDWRMSTATAREMFEAFTIMRPLHELLWYLSEALRMPLARPLRRKLTHALADTERLALGNLASLRELDIAAHRQDVNILLLRSSELVRAGVPGPRLDRRGADLIGADLRGADLRGANLRGAHLIGADLRGADVRAADLIGVDFRGADLRGADLTGALYLIQSQLDAARGDSATKLSPSLGHPAHWSGSPTRRSSVRGPK